MKLHFNLQTGMGGFLPEKCAIKTFPSNWVGFKNGLTAPFVQSVQFVHIKLSRTHRRVCVRACTRVCKKYKTIWTVWTDWTEGYLKPFVIFNEGLNGV